MDGWRPGISAETDMVMSSGEHTLMSRGVHTFMLWCVYTLMVILTPFLMCLKGWPIWHFEGVYAVIDLYGQCAKVSITSGGLQALKRGHVISETDQSTLVSPTNTGTFLFHLTKYILG